MAEIELKLAAVPSDLPALKRALETLHKRCSTAASLLTSIYYDSSDHKLRQHNLTLRVREQDGQHVQTVKAGDLKGDVASLSWRASQAAKGLLVHACTDLELRERRAPRNRAATARHGSLGASTDGVALLTRPP